MKPAEIVTWTVWAEGGALHFTGTEREARQFMAERPPRVQRTLYMEKVTVIRERVS